MIQFLRRPGLRIAAIVAVLLVSTIIPFVNAGHASANGETYTWKSATEIDGCGGDFGSNCAIFKQLSIQPTTFVLSNDVMYHACGLINTNGNSFCADCQVQKSNSSFIAVTSDTTGIRNWQQVTNPTIQQTPIVCPANNPLFNTNVPVTLSGTRPGAPNGGFVDVGYAYTNSNGPNGQVATGTIKAGSDQPASAPSLQNALSTGTSNPWTATFPAKVGPGDYTMCVDIANQCKNFTVPANATTPISVMFGTTDPSGDPTQGDVIVRAGTNVSGQLRAEIKTADGASDVVSPIDFQNYGPNPVYQVTFNNIKNGVDYEACLSASGALIGCKPFNRKDGDTPVIQIDQTATDSNSAVDGPELKCETSIFNPITWLICPLVAAAQAATTAMNNAIDDQLTIQSDPIFNASTDSGKAFHTAWGSFRNISLVVIVLAGLIMIISQAAGVEFLDAYTLRKVLPRLIIATIFITLSWPLLKFAVDLTNQIGTGIRSLIYQPFKSIGQGGITLDMGSQFVAALVGSVAVLALGLLALLSFAITAFIAVLMGFVLLLLRKAVLIFLVLVAPFAIACSILPNTRRVWDLWRDTLISMLLVFPVISAFIAICRVFAVVFYNSGS